MKKTLPFVVLMFAAAVHADWREFRGPGHLGQSDERGLPIQWGETENVVWKVKLPGPGASSPVIVGDRVFVTSFTGKKAAEIVRYVQCFERTTGKLQWEQKRPAPLPENNYAAQLVQHGFATSTPCSDGERLYVSFGRGGVYAFDLAGNEIWHREIGKGLNTFGSGSSLTLAGDLLLVNACTENGALLAFQKSTGERVWRSTLPGDCWATPVIVTLPDGRQEVVVNAEDGLYGIDLKTGTQNWTCDTVGGYVSSTPIVNKDVVYAIGSSVKRMAIAVRAGGKGDVTKTHVLWKNEQVGVSYCSPLLVGDRLVYFSGNAVALDTTNGKIVNQKYFEGTGSIYGSPIHAEGRFYLFTRNQGAYVVADDFKELAHNDLGDTSAIHASPAASHGCLFIRSNEYLYCLGKR
jgi:outer membrane protein assembly factor BamB